MENNSDNMYLVEAMDHLWFHKMVLSSQSLLCQESLKSPTYQISNDFCTQEDEVSSELSALTLSQINESKIENQLEKKRPIRLTIHASKSFSFSSSISTKRRSKNLKYSGSLTGLNKTMSCKSLEELEIEEVKGFIDLGFKFNVEKLNPRVIKVLPGLQRLKNQETGEKDQENHETGEKNQENQETGEKNQENQETGEKNQENEETGEEEETNVMKRPYLSEAWSVQKSELPLIKLKVPSVGFEEYDMKKHIKNWARIVAYSIALQES